MGATLEPGQETRWKVEVWPAGSLGCNLGVLSSCLVELGPGETGGRCSQSYLKVQVSGVRGAEEKLNLNSLDIWWTWAVVSAPLKLFLQVCVSCKLHMCCISGHENGVDFVIEGGDDFNVTLE